MSTFCITSHRTFPSTLVLLFDRYQLVLLSLSLSLLPPKPPISIPNLFFFYMCTVHTSLYLISLLFFFYLYVYCRIVCGAFRRCHCVVFIRHPRNRFVSLHFILSHSVKFYLTLRSLLLLSLSSSLSSSLSLSYKVKVHLILSKSI